MRIVFLSNFYNHHQSIISRDFYKLSGGNYWFVECESIPQERLDMGYVKIEDDFIVSLSNENREYVLDLIMSADLVINGGAPRELYQPRLDAGKLVFLYSERLYKQGYDWWRWPVRQWRMYTNYERYSNLYLLCASAYTAHDFAVNNALRNRAFKWGYFPEHIDIDISSVLEKKDPKKILWAARLIDWKHPEAAVNLAEKLKESRTDFSLDIIGTGDMTGTVSEMIAKKNLRGYVNLLGAMSPQKVREHMLQAGIFIHTADFKEGWGAVVNEAMSSGCAVVASHAIGAAPFLINSGENGLIYQSGNTDELFSNVCSLISNRELCNKLGEAAYHTMASEWRPEIAAERMFHMADSILNGHGFAPYSSGPCSIAPDLKNNWYR